MEQIDRNIEEFTSRQALSGASGLRAYASENPGLDFEQVVTSPSPTFGRSVAFTANWQADGSQRYPFVSPFVNVYANGQKLDPRTWRWSDGTNSVVVQTLLAMDGMNLETPYSRRWYSEAVVFGTVTLAFKFKLFGTSPGVVTTEAVLT
ncbi:hypothetical protein [Dietzia cinnamea]|uniref:hypothetical protein n=1 Tax=Dietzia cinnamea TaxID=321318 RepID=UPI00223B990F|nr:hypothetical protein [Dietzia cinnamea]MCT2076060.1 hypothetical protein [Dietzia cinnamea]MCT2219799.1 hypothetical protein [Dietzia cinnamea]